MRPDYDIFEKFPDGSFIWRACVSGQFHTRRKMQDLAEHSENEFMAVDIKAGELLPFILGRVNDSSMQIKNEAKRIA